MNKSRRQEILEKSSMIFSEKGFDGTSMRDISRATGLYPASIYYHFKSKEEIFVEAHSLAVKTIEGVIKGKIEGIDDPWIRLEEAAAAHAESLLESPELRLLLVPKFPSESEAYSDKLISQRDDYESILAGIISDLPLPKSADRELFRLQLLGSLNWMQTWYKKNFRLSAADIGREFVRTMRC